MVWLLAFDRLTVKAKAVVPVGVKQVVASGFCLWLELSGVLFWSFWIVPVPVPLAIVALVAPDRVTVKVSSGSNAVSAHTSTVTGLLVSPGAKVSVPRSEEHTSELQSQSNLVCRLLLEKKNKIKSHK